MNGWRYLAESGSQRAVVRCKPIDGNVLQLTELRGWPPLPQSRNEPLTDLKTERLGGISRGNPQWLKRDIEFVDLQQLVEFCDLEHFTDICRGVVQMDFDTLFPNGSEQS